MRTLAPIPDETTRAAACVRLVAGALSVAVLLGCAAPTTTSTTSSSWMTEVAEERYAAGRLDAALRQTERALQANYRRPEPRLLALHITILKDLGKTAEADAFREYAERYAAGENLNEGETTPPWRVCRSPQRGENLIRAWGNFGNLKPSGNYDIRTIAASFEIESSGEIANIRVMRALYPASAWLLIDAVAEAGISPSGLARLREETPDPFPIPLCVWWNYDRIDDRFSEDRERASRKGFLQRPAENPVRRQ